MAVRPPAARSGSLRGPRGAGRRTSGRPAAAFGTRRGWLRWLLIGIPLLAVVALVLQTAAHANPARHAIHQDPVATSASHCDRHHAAPEHRGEPAAGCATVDSDPSPMDCCQTCLVCVVPLGTMTFGPSVAGDAFVTLRPDPHERSPEGILRPPRPAVA